MVQDRAIVTTYVIYRSAAFSLTIKMFTFKVLLLLQHFYWRLL